jgi:hypothetical protein
LLAASCGRFLFLTAAAYDCAGGLVKNLRIFATLASGVQLELRDCPTGRDLVRALLRHTDEPARALVIEATDKDGHVVRIVVPGDDSEVAKVSIGKEA